MKDQVEVLRRKGVKAANLDSSLDVSEAIGVKNGVRTGDLKILYVAPERSVFILP
jgi:superfamily II DNA helicase RecQ